MAYTKDNPGIWTAGKQVYPGDIYMVIAADVETNGTYTAGNYFLATKSFTCNKGGSSHITLMAIVQQLTGCGLETNNIL